jgi:arabinofuranan 3-O-arabinosyltransferase
MIFLPPVCRTWLGRTALFLFHRVTRRVLAWLALLICTAIAGKYAWTCYDDPTRRDGNYGHATIDFGGQWLMGRMLVTGNGRRLYDRFTQRQVLEEAYPYTDSQEPRVADLLDGRLAAASAADLLSGEFAALAATDPFSAAAFVTAAPQIDPGDVQRILDWMIGDDDDVTKAVGGYLAPLAATEPFGAAAQVTTGCQVWTRPPAGGPLYPPINAYLYAPLGMLPPRIAYRVMETFNLALTFAIGLLAQRITGGRMWWQVGTILVMGCPGYSGALNLGQNALFTLFLLMLGWRQLQLGRSGFAGVLWGLMAFKPVWAASFFLVPLLTRRWRMAATMAATGSLLAVATLPAVGMHSWVDWLSVGSRASDLYGTCETWIFLSRDLIGMPRRYLLTFIDDYAAPDDPLGKRATAIGLGLWLTPLVFTIAAMMRRGPRAARVTNGPLAAFVLFGAWLACYHFMYYDVLIAYLPCCLLYAEPRRVLRRIARGMPPGTWRGLFRSAVATVLLIVLSALPYWCVQHDRPPVYHFLPWDTLCIVSLWLWCDVAHGQDSARTAQLGDSSRGVGGPHERLADEDSADAASQQLLDVGPGANAALTHQANAATDLGGDGRGDFERVAEPGHERA